MDLRIAVGRQIYYNNFPAVAAKDGYRAVGRLAWK
jgi:hypothetical protein